MSSILLNNSTLWQMLKKNQIIKNCKLFQISLCLCWSLSQKFFRRGLNIFWKKNLVLAPNLCKSLQKELKNESLKNQERCEQDYGYINSSQISLCCCVFISSNVFLRTTILFFLYSLIWICFYKTLFYFLLLLTLINQNNKTKCRFNKMK